MKKVLVLATLDTKYKEALILADFIREYGCRPRLLDCSLRHSRQTGESSLRPEMLSRHHMTEEQLGGLEKNEALSLMTNMVREELVLLYQNQELDGVIGIGGVQGTLISTGAMRALPVGVPKMALSAVANGNTMFGPLVGLSDMTITHSVVDIAGSNQILKLLMSNAAAAVCGMVNKKQLHMQEAQAIGMTMGGVTTVCGNYVKDMLEQRGYEVITFHCNGIGAMAMENLAGEGKLRGVIDLTPHDVTDYLCSGMMPADRNRYKIYQSVPIPVMIIPGCADIILYNGIHNVPARLRNRKLIEHNNIHTHVKADYGEMYRLGKFIAQRAEKCLGPVKILIPEQGFSQKNCPGGPLYEPESDRGFADALTGSGKGRADVLKIPFHINDYEFARTCVSEFIPMLRREGDE